MDNKGFKDYTRMRDIVVKRNKRAVSAGLMKPVHFPTVREIKAGFVSAKEAFKAVENYYSSGSTVKAIRQTGIKPLALSFPVMPVPEKLTEEVKKERRRRQQRDYRRRKRIDRDTYLNTKDKDYYKRFIKALQTAKDNGHIEGNLDIDQLTPNEALAFAEYLDFRFDQGKFNDKYIIVDFMNQFEEIKGKVKNLAKIPEDFNKFLLDRKELTHDELKHMGISAEESTELWQEFIDDIEEWT